MNPKSSLSLALTTSILAACSTGSVVNATLPAPSTPQLTRPLHTPLPERTSTPAGTATSIRVDGSSVPRVSFAKDVLPIFEAACTKCHGVEEIKEGLDLRTYAGLQAGSFNGPVIVPGNAAGSFLVQQLIDGEMPKRGQKLPPGEIQIISDWIDEGALNN